MIKSKEENKSISFIMGTDSDIKDKLDDIGATYQIEDEKYYLVKIPNEKLSEYENVISEYLKPGFWNEYIGREVVFIFKTMKGKIIRYVWNDSNEKDILKLCNEYAGFNKISIQEMLLSEPFYHENSIIID